MRVHIVDRSLIIPLKLLRIINNPDKIHLMYHKDDSRFGIRALKEPTDGAIYIPQEVYSGRWRGIRIENDVFIDLIYSIIQRDTGRYFVEPHFNEYGFIVHLDETVKSDYNMKPDKYYLIDLE